MPIDPSGSDLRRELTLFDSTMINVGSIIASAIFIVPAAVAGHLPSGPLMMAVWIVGGIISLFGAVTIAELGGMMPRAGGQYVFLAEIYGPLWGFLYGWSAFVVIISAAISAIAVAFATYLGYFFPLSGMEIKIIAIASIAVLTVMNCFGVKLGAIVQNGFTLLKIAALGVLILLCLFLTGGETSILSSSLPAMPLTSLAGPMVLAMIAVLWAYDGWIEVTFIAGEVRDPQTNIHRSLIIATLIVIVMYVLANLGYLAVLPIEAMASSQLVASDAAAAVLGSAGAAFVAGAVVLSTFGANNGYVITGARIYYAMAKEGLFFRSFGKVHPRFKTPIPSLIGQGVWASVLVLTGSYEQLFTYVVFASWIFYAMACYGVILLRKRMPDVPRPYSAWGYPSTAIIFILFALLLVVLAVIESPGDALIGTVMIASGIPAYYYWSHRKNNERTFPGADSQS
ncbi:MAG: amino acid permease [Ignavibacteriales bacterium]|nr:amino acid permease [Ignavibacteriales bacterium]